MSLVAVNTDFSVTAIAPAATATETPTATARIHHIDGNSTDVRSCHHAGFPLMIDTMALNASLSVRETGSDGTTIPGDRCLVKVGNGGAGE